MILTIARVEELINRQVALLSEGEPTRWRLLNTATVITLTLHVAEREIGLYATQTVPASAVVEARCAMLSIKATTAWLQENGSTATKEALGEQVDTIIWEALHIVALVQSLQEQEPVDRRGGTQHRSA